VVMQKKSELIFRFVQFTDVDKEQETIAIQKAKKEFVVSTMGGAADSVQIARAIERTNINDKDFLEFLHAKVPQLDSLEIGKACSRLYSQSELELMLKSLIIERNKQVKNYFLDTQKISPEMLEVSTSDLNNVPEELKFPHFKIEVTVR
jgi:hypothetical protein